jgi:hypothetical protein
LIHRSSAFTRAALGAALVILLTSVAVRAADSGSAASVGLAVDGGQALVPEGGRFVVRVAAGGPGDISIRYRARDGREATFPDGHLAMAAAGEQARTLTAPAVPGRYDLRVVLRNGDSQSASLVKGALVVSGPALLPDDRCDVLDPAHCLLPFPNDWFTAAAPGTATGRLLNLNVLSMPTNTFAKPVQPGEWNRNDGFSPGAMVLARVPNLDLHATWGTKALPAEQRDHLADIARYRLSEAPIVIINTRTGERHPFWSELDLHPDTPESKRLLILRPAVNFDEGTRYIVALRNMRRADGSVIEPSSAFRGYRDGTAGGARRPAMDDLFATLARAGIARGDLFLAWDFTVASRDNLAGRALHIRDEAFRLLGDDNLADGIVQGSSPRFRITEVIDSAPTENRGTGRTVRGSIQVPNFLTPQVTAEIDTSPVEIPVVGGTTLPVALPLSRFVYLPGSGGKPQRDLVQPFVDVPFDCYLPHTTAHGERGAYPTLYGHGLLGDRGEAGGSSTEDLRLRGFAMCAVDWWGMSTADLANVALILSDITNFKSLADRVQQGFLNFLYLGRALIHPDGLASDPAFRGSAGRPLLDTRRLYYDGNSQGGIMGGSLTALAPDFTTAKLGVPAMNYSTLLNRSVDWEGSYGAIAYAFYRDPVVKQLFFALIQMLWDRAETNGYAHHVTDDPLPNTPPHQVLLQVAYADHQVANVAAEVEGRTIGAKLRRPELAPGQHWSVDPAFGFETATYGVPGSFLTYWYSGDRDNTRPPNGNLPSTSGEDPHSDPRKDNRASDQVAHFLLTGTLIDVCDGGPCVTVDASRKND